MDRRPTQLATYVAINSVGVKFCNQSEEAEQVSRGRHQSQPCSYVAATVANHPSRSGTSFNLVPILPIDIGSSDEPPHHSFPPLAGCRGCIIAANALLTWCRCQEYTDRQAAIVQETVQR